MQKDTKRDMLIILAEDNEDDILLFKSVLTNLPLNFRFCIYKNGRDLLAGISKPSVQKQQIIFLDINIPVKGGMEILSEIRRKISSDLPVFLLSTANDHLIVEQARKACATGYLSKPNDTMGLRSMLNNVLSINWDQRSVDDFYVHLQYDEANVNRAVELSL